MSDPATSEASTIAGLSARVRAEFPKLDFDSAELIEQGDDNRVLVLDALRRLLDIDKLAAAAIERGARAKYQVA